MLNVEEVEEQATQEAVSAHLADLYKQYQELQEREIRLLACGLVALEHEKFEKLYHINNEIIYVRMVQDDIKEYLQSCYKKVVSLH